MAPRGPLLATEDRDRHRLRGRAGRRQGNRGSVALIGPTQSGKTVVASAGIVAWDGPVVALSVKRDLYDATAVARAGRGEVAVFDPGGVTGLRSARWSPLRDVTTASGALRAGRALAQAIPSTGVQGGDFWAQHGEAFISAYFSLAGLSQLLPNPDGTARDPLTIERLATWAYMGAGITDPVINELVRFGLAEDQPLEVRLLARNAVTKLMAFHREDPRIRGSIYATARLAFESWSEPSVAHSASHDACWAYNSPDNQRWDRRPRWIDLGWLIGEPDDGRANTLFLCAPDTEFARLAPVLGGLLGDLREQVHAWDTAGRRLSKPLLFVIDEAGQLELGWLPAEVSTIAGLGAIIVTCWQSKAQISHRYGTLADAVLGGHRSKVFFAGTDDPSTIDYLSRVTGSQHVAQRGWSAELRGGHRTVSEHPQREDLLPGHIVRQMRRHEAVLLHGTLPPIHLRSVLWWQDPKLARLVPTDDHGRPAPPPDLPTCPLSSDAPGPPGPMPDLTAVGDPASYLPRSRRPAAPDGRGPQGTESTPGDDTPERPHRGSGPPDRSLSRAGRRDSRVRSRQQSQRRPSLRGQTPLPFGTTSSQRREPEPQDEEWNLTVDSDPVEANRVAGICERCSRWVQVGEGEAIRFGHRVAIRCYPICPAGSDPGSAHTR